MVDGVKGLSHGLYAVTAQVLHQRGQFGVAAPVDQGRHIALIAEIIHQPLAPDCTAHEGQRGIFLIGAGIDPVAQMIATGFLERGPLQDAMFDPHHIPAEGVENLLDPPEQPFAYDSVQ